MSEVICKSCVNTGIGLMSKVCACKYGKEKELNDTIQLKDEDAVKIELFGRSMHDTTIHHYLNLFQKNELTYSQALHGMVIHLSNEKNHLTNQLISEINNRVR